MNMHDPNEIILRAVDAFNRRMLVVSPQFEILAIRGQADDMPEADVVGKKCYKILYSRNSPCDECPTLEVGRKRQPALTPGYHPDLLSRQNTVFIFLSHFCRRGYRCFCDVGF